MRHGYSLTDETILCRRGCINALDSVQPQARALQHQPPLLSIGYGLEGQRPGLSRSAAIFQGLVVVALHQNFSERQNEAENAPEVAVL